MVNYLRARCIWGDLKAPTVNLKVGAILAEVTAPTLKRTRKPSASTASDCRHLLGKWHRLGMYHLIDRRCACHCAAHLPCHVDALVDAFLRLVPHRTTFLRLPKLDGPSSAEAGLHLRAHVGWLAWALGLLPHGKWMHDSAEREAQRGLLPFPLSSSSPGHPMTPEMALAARPRCEEKKMCRLFLFRTSWRRRVAVPGEVGTQLDARCEARSAEPAVQRESQENLGTRKHATVCSEATSR